MKLRNKNTGQVENFCIDKDQICSCDRAFVYDSLTQLQEAGWEDYEEPTIWYINDRGYGIFNEGHFTSEGEEAVKSIGNYFETKEEAEKAVEKLKAWKRLKDKGFEFESWFGGSKDISFWLDTEIDEDIAKDLDLLFGGEE